MKRKRQYIGTIDGNRLLSKRRVMLFNKPVVHKNKKKEKQKYKCRKKIKSERS